MPAESGLRSGKLGQRLALATELVVASTDGTLLLPAIDRRLQRPQWSLHEVLQQQQQVGKLLDVAGLDGGEVHSR